ncbi:MAG: UvrD-helicase domain-containing protein, partial [Phyllobacteriaceae bacterium]|nr:UvrD-helicase domain-containing protein [Phyllobacteriaceae bacterium]
MGGGRSRRRRRGMSGKFVVPDDTKTRQRCASDPAVSAWVSANAGSGKTHVLTQRVIRS